MNSSQELRSCEAHLRPYAVHPVRLQRTLAWLSAICTPASLQPVQE